MAQNYRLQTGSRQEAGEVQSAVLAAQEEEARQLIDDYRANGASDDDSLPLNDEENQS